MKVRNHHQRKQQNFLIPMKVRNHHQRRQLGFLQCRILNNYIGIARVDEITPNNRRLLTDKTYAAIRKRNNTEKYNSLDVVIVST
jgi:hypothetical protein